MLSDQRTLAIGLVSVVISLPSVVMGADIFMPEMTFTEVFNEYDTAVIARLDNATVIDVADQNEAISRQLEVVDVLKSEQPTVQVDITVRMPSIEADGELYLLAGNKNKSGKISRWRVAMPVTQACHQHVLNVVQMKQTGAERLAFFQTFLEHADESVRANAHMEFVVATDDAFAAACDQLDRATIRKWLSEGDIALDRQRLYLAMLARCGNEADGQWLQKVLEAEETPSLLPVKIGCFLTLKGEAGLPLVRRLYLNNPEASFIESYSAIMALRFVRDLPESPLSRASLIASFRLVLDNKLMADLVIPDLAYLEDWDSLDRLVELFKGPDIKWARCPIVNFVRACPLPTAKERLKELTDFDAEAVRRAQMFFPQPVQRKKVSIRRHYSGTKFRC